MNGGSPFYQALRIKYLGIILPPTAPIVIEQAKPSQKQINNLKAEEAHARSSGSACLAFATTGVVLGCVMVGIGVHTSKQDINSQGYASRHDNGIEIAGIILSNITLPLWIAGGIEIGRANHYKRQVAEATSCLRLDISPTAMVLTF